MIEFSNAQKSEIKEIVTSVNYLLKKLSNILYPSDFSDMQNVKIEFRESSFSNCPFTNGVHPAKINVTVKENLV